MLLFMTANLPLGGQFLKQLLDKGPVVIVLVAILVIGYRRYNKVIDGFVEDMRKFMNSTDNKITGMDIKIDKILNKLENK